MSQTLAVKYRPKTLSDVLGQNITVKILQKVIEKRNFRSCYLFAGDSGCGKTSCARAFAMAINQGCGFPEEIDAASHGGVEDVRAIIEAAKQRSLDSEYKIFIIDECHAITSAGWQAFLKAIEEPAPYTIYIFCTTEPNKLPETILNRMQRYNITKISALDIQQRLLAICAAEGFTNYSDTCDLISKTSHGCMRDAIMKLEQCANYSTDLSLENTETVLGIDLHKMMFSLIWALQDKDEKMIFKITDKLNASGIDLKNFVNLLLEFTIDLSKFKLFNDINLTNIPVHFANGGAVQSTVQAVSAEWFTALIDVLLAIKLEIKYDVSYKSTIEAFLLKFCR